MPHPSLHCTSCSHGQRDGLGGFEIAHADGYVIAFFRLRNDEDVKE